MLETEYDTWSSASTTVAELSVHESWLFNFIIPFLASENYLCIFVIQKTTYYYIIANAKFMLDDEEHFQEQMQEKLRMYGERNKEQDFWMVIEPQFLDKHPEVASRLNRPAVALVSTDKVWIT